MYKKCPNCQQQTHESNFVRVPSGIRCRDCIESTEVDFVTKSIITFQDLREAAIEEGIDEDLADNAYDAAVDRLMEKYR